MIIGAGPTGLGAATRINQHGHKDWLIIDQVKPAKVELTRQLPICRFAGHLLFRLDRSAVGLLISTLRGKSCKPSPHCRGEKLSSSLRSC